MKGLRALWRRIARERSSWDWFARAAIGVPLAIFIVTAWLGTRADDPFYRVPDFDYGAQNFAERQK